MEAMWTILIASLTALNCSLIGTYLVLRKAAMMGDAIAHAILPGLVVAFLLTSSKASCVMLLGAGSIGLLATFLMAFLQKKVGLQMDASIGINFTWLFALGVILISLYSKKIDLDPECTLYGEVAYAPLDLWQLRNGISLGPRAVYVLGAMLLLNLIFILFGYKELMLTTFDPAFAATVGIPTTLWHYLLMGATSLTIVSTFEVAGVILVVAFLVVPPATAYLVTQRLNQMLLIAALLGIAIAIGGYFLTVWINGSIASVMATLAGVLFSITFLITQQSVSKQAPWNKPSRYFSLFIKK